MSTEYRKRYVAQKGLLVDKHGNILLLKSSAPNGDGDYWDFPGGQMEPGEGALETLKREIQEEIGVEIDVNQSQPLHVLSTKGFGSMSSDDILKIFHIIPVGAVEVKLSQEHSEFRWVNVRNPIPAEISGFAREVLMAYRKFAHIQEADRRIVGYKGFGLIQVIHGHGKGKTTSSLGLAVRAAGAGKRVGIVYFDKGGSSHYSERKIIDRLPEIDYVPTGRDRIDPVTGRFDFSITDIDKLEADRGIQKAHEMLTNGAYDLVILDEINSTCDLGMVDFDRVLKLMDEKQPHVELVLTGRNPHPAFLERAHLVSEIGLNKHYFYSGVEAREGIDY